MATPRKLWETNVGLRPATHIMSTFVCLAIVFIPFPIRLNTDNEKGIIFDKLVKHFVTAKPSIPNCDAIFRQHFHNIFTIAKQAKVGI